MTSEHKRHVAELKPNKRKQRLLGMPELRFACSGLRLSNVVGRIQWRLSLPGQGAAFVASDGSDAGWGRAVRHAGVALYHGVSKIGHGAMGRQQDAKERLVLIG